MVSEVVLGMRFLYAKLSTDSSLMTLAPGGVHRGSAPSGTATPFVVIAHQAGRDSLTMNRTRLMSKILYQVRAVGPAKNTTAIEGAANRIDTLLKKEPGAPPESVSGGLIDAYYREEPLQFDEIVPPGDKWSNYGGLYRLEIEQT
jgi:hypothetical protein